MVLNFIKLLRRCHSLAHLYGQQKLYGVFLIFLLNGFFQAVGVASIFPFLALASDPARMRRSSPGQAVLAHCPPMTDNQLLVAVGILSMAILVVSNLIALLTEFVRARYAAGFGHWLRCALLDQIVSRPYSYFIKTNSSVLAQKVIPDVMTFIQNVFMPLTDVASRTLTLLFLITAALVANPGIALGAALLFGLSYPLVFLWVRPRAHEAGQGFRQHNLAQHIATQELLTGIKPVLVHGKASEFVRRVKFHSSQIGPLTAKVSIFSNGPRYLIEPVAFGSLVAIVIVLAGRGLPFTNILPTIAVLALAGYRMLPNVQLLYLQLSNVAAFAYTLKEIESEIRDPESFGKNTPTKISPAAGSAVPEKISFRKAIRLENVTFAYPGGQPPVLNGFSLEIPRFHSIGIAGMTGSGKSTLVDLILGLHRPSGGCLKVDDLVITDPLVPAWRQMIGYVPQDIFLLDDTLAANIAFGIEPNLVDPAQLRRAAQAAQILDFIEGELPEKFLTQVGERGVRLSGGQRQRIGIARALYHQPEILILDEATSALDMRTEAAVMQTIRALQGSITMIIIAHRLTTLEGCDAVAEIRKPPVAVAA